MEVSPHSKIPRRETVDREVQGTDFVKWVAGRETGDLPRSNF